MDKAERTAQVIVEAVILGAEMLFCRDQSAGRHDFNLHFPSGEMAALEVTTSTDEKLISTIAAISNPRKGVYFFPATRCQRDWLVHPRPRARINKMRCCIDRYLAEVEAAGLDGFIGPTDCPRYPAVDRIYKELAIEAGVVTAWKKPRQIGIWPPGAGGEVTSKHVQEAVRAEAFKADNRMKLAKVGYRQRHLFVYVDPRNYLTWRSLVDQYLPAEAPPLPGEVSHVWVVAETRDRDHFVVLRGPADTGWSEPEFLCVQTPST